MTSPEYAYDGETFFSRRALVSDKDRLEIHFAFEGSLEGTPKCADAWKFHGVFLPDPPSPLTWSSDISSVDYSPSLSNDGAETEGLPDGTAPAGYWDSPCIQLAEPPEGTEEDYWAQYASPSMSARPSPLISRKQSSIGPKPQNLRPAASPLLRSETLPRSETDNSPTPSSSSDLAQRLRTKVSDILRRTWIDYLGEEKEEGAVEEKALRWLSIGRGLSALSKAAQRGPSGASVGDDQAVRGKMQLLAEMYEVVEDSEEGFYRLVEAALKEGDVPRKLERRFSSEQVGYWES